MKKFLLLVIVFIGLITANAQNVGIGTTTPAAALDVNSSVGFTSKFNANNNQMYMGIYENNNIRGYWGSYAGNAEDVDFGTPATNVTGKLRFTIWAIPKMTINNSGNVGIGTTTPAVKLHVTGDGFIGGQLIRAEETQNDYARIGFYNAGTSNFWEANAISNNVDANALYNIYYSNTGYLLSIKGNGNVGIGEQDPAYKLDLNGRMRLKHTTNTAGIYFDGVTLSTRSFIGTFSDDYVGLYGSGGAGWNMVMNVENGNIGMGTTTPTAPLDLNGTMRIRGGSPVAGSVLTSIDANGNAVWKTNKVGFNARMAENVAIPHNQYTKVEFSNET
jgi:hypothetical protein